MTDKHVNAVRERPILFSKPMVLALLAGTKTQTRRIVKPQPKNMPILANAYTVGADRSKDGNEWLDADCINAGVPMICPYGAPGDELFVKETWRTSKEWDALKPSELPIANEFMVSPYLAYAADGPSKELHGKTRVSIFMPRWASRITLEIKSVRVERLQSISEEDALAEGIDGAFWHPCYSAGYMALWESINGPGSWELNPWVWAISFKRI